MTDSIYRWKHDAVRKKLAQWYWSGVFGELYGGAVETRFAKDLAEFLSWIDGGGEPATVKDAGFRAERLNMGIGGITPAQKLKMAA